MSVTVIYLLSCNYEGCAERMVGDTAWETRERARAQGWQCGKTLRSRDLCEKHALIRTT